MLHLSLKFRKCDACLPLKVKLFLPDVPEALGRDRSLILLFILMVGVALSVTSCSTEEGIVREAGKDAEPPAAVLESEPPPGDGWKPLFNRRNLDGWEITQFGGEGDVEVTSGKLLLEMGNDLTGVTWASDFPKVPFEVVLEGQRVRGNDFFCGLTFPVGEEYCTLVLGGWGGALVGLSSIDGKDASENETRTYMNFENERWYTVQLQVSPESITAWIDGEEIIETERAGHEFSVRPEVRLSRPFGIATWRTTAAIRSIWYRELQESQRD